MAKDLHHDIVRRALEKDGWTITDDPLKLEYGGKSLKADLGAEKVLTATKGTTKIAVEIKGFTGESLIQGFYIALGQYLSYLKILIGTKSDRILYLAVPEDKHKKMQKSDFYKEMLEDYKMKL